MISKVQIFVKVVLSYINHIFDIILGACHHPPSADRAAAEKTVDRFVTTYLRGQIPQDG